MKRTEREQFLKTAATALFGSRRIDGLDSIEFEPQPRGLIQIRMIYGFKHEILMCRRKDFEQAAISVLRGNNESLY